MMKFEYYKDHYSMSFEAGKFIYRELLNNPSLLLCAASGSSPHKAYELFVEYLEANPTATDKLTVLKLDEWRGIPMKNAHTCESFLQGSLIQPLQLSSSQFISFNSESSDLNQECNRISTWLAKRGPIDLCILGLGKNGHLGFNEPSDHLTPFAHIAELSEPSMQHLMVQKMRVTPSCGLTLGMGELLQSKKILLLISGEGKQAAIDKLLSGKITPQLPASFLWLHPNVTCLFDQNKTEVDHNVLNKPLVN